MFWLRFHSKNGISFGYLDGELIKEVEGDFLSGRCRDTGRTFFLSEVEVDVPCVPGKIIGVGLNYRDHAKELEMDVPAEPVLFLKPPSTLLRHKAAIVLPPGAGRVDYEAELAVVIGKQAKNVSEKKAKSCIAGYSCGNDVTARDLQRRDGQWTRAKSFDTFCPFGPWIAAGLDPSSLEVSLQQNGVRKQQASCSQLIFSVEEVVSRISKVMTLEPGDVILTGTPPGVGPMRSGDSITVSITGIGALTNTVC